MPRDTGDNGRRRRRVSRSFGPTKHRAVHLDDVTYAQGNALAARENLSFSAWIGLKIRECYSESLDEEE